jgi:hypothetical protein
VADVVSKFFAPDSQQLGRELHAEMRSGSRQMAEAEQTLVPCGVLHARAGDQPFRPEVIGKGGRELASHRRFHAFRGHSSAAFILLNVGVGLKLIVISGIVRA